jgi:diguanylate cyclase (GGDEF)-like protein
VKNWGIRARVLLLGLLPLLLLAPSLSWYFTSSRLADLDRALEERGVAIVRQLAPTCEYGLFAGNLDDLRNLALNAKREPDVLAVSIHDRQGREVVRVGEWLRLDVGHSVMVKEADRLASASRDVLVMAAPVHVSAVFGNDLFAPDRMAPVPREPIGYVSLQLSRSATLTRQREVLLNSLYITVTTVLLTLVLALRLGRDISEPVRKITRAVNAIADGNLDRKVEGEYGGEFRVLRDGVNHMVGALAQSRDHLQEKIAAATARLSWQATHDALTGLTNRQEFEARVNRALASARQYGREHALVFMDLDQFKIVNDTCGHAAGDELLRRLTVLLQHHMRDRDTLARLGGDEFGVLLENCPLDMAVRIAETLRGTVQDFRFGWGGRVFSLGVSIGLVEINADSLDLPHLLSAADAACYAAKDGGRNRVHVYQAQDHELKRRRGEMQWAQRLTDALQNNRLLLYYQKVERIQPSPPACGHYEVLLRLDGEDGLHVPPMSFLPAAERYQLMPAIDRWVVERVLGLCGRLPASKAGEVIFAVNVSGASLGDADFNRFILGKMAEIGPAARSMCLEITETAAIGNLGRAQALIDSLRQLGCRFALDDFGGGLSSFNQLKNLPVDFLKIDGAFVRDMTEDPLDCAMVEAINTLGHKMNIRTVAESVDGPEVLAKLREMGVDYAQGNWLHSPAPLSELDEP